MVKPKIKGHAGVAFFGQLSLDADVKAFEWAYKHLPLSDEYKLRIIHVNELSNGSQPQERPDSRYGYDGVGDVTTKFKENYPHYSEIEGFLTNLFAHNVHEYICGVAYQGGNFEATLQYAVEKEKAKHGLDILVLAWWEEDDGRKGPPITISRLESEGCSIVFAKVDSSRKLTLSMPSTQTMSATMASTEDPTDTAAPPSSMAAALRDQPSNDGTHSASSNANRERRDDRAPAASTEMSESITPASAQPVAAPTERPKRSTSKHSSKAPASGSEIDSTPRRPAGRDKDTGSATPSSSRKTKAR